MSLYLRQSEDKSSFLDGPYLTEHGLTPDDVLRYCLGAVEYRALNGDPCWSISDLLPLFDNEEVRS
jgi:hypothetical protein